MTFCLNHCRFIRFNFKRALLLLPLSFAVIVLIAGANLKAADTTGSVHELTAVIKKVGPNGAGHAEAKAAMVKLNELPPSHLVDVVRELNDANPLAANWIRGCIDKLIERSSKTKTALPVAELEKVVLDPKNGNRTRRTAFEILTTVDKTAPDRLLPKMLEDPSLELRRDAIDRLVKETNDLDGEKKLAGYQKAFDLARDPDQVRAIAKRLRELKQTIDLPRKFGLLMDWHAIGLFDNTKQKGFDVANPPEEKIDLAATYDGKSDKVKWTTAHAKEENGSIDLNAAVGEKKEVTAYVYTDFEIEKPTACQFRVGCSSAHKVWVNGELVHARNIYHSLPEMDQYVFDVKFKAGKNTILVKVLQDDLAEEWAKGWEFSLRVCDEQGSGILGTNREPTPATALQQRSKEKSGVGL